MCSWFYCERYVTVINIRFYFFILSNTITFQCSTCFFLISTREKFLNFEMGLVHCFISTKIFALNLCGKTHRVLYFQTDECGLIVIEVSVLFFVFSHATFCVYTLYAGMILDYMLLYIFFVNCVHQVVNSLGFFFVKESEENQHFFFRRTSNNGKSRFFFYFSMHLVPYLSKYKPSALMKQKKKVFHVGAVVLKHRDHF